MTSKNVALCWVLIAAFAMVGCAGVGQNIPVSKLILIGDVPYGASPKDTLQFEGMPKFIASINQDTEASTVVHLGDIHAGKQYCTESYDQSIAALFATFTKPLIYTVGDNEWTDCHKAKEGGGSYNKATGQIDYIMGSDGKLVDYASGNPLSNLELVRSLFFRQPGTTLGVAMAVHSQALEYDPANPADKAFVENVWWEKNGVFYVNMNLPGGSNDDTDPWYGTPAMSAAQSQEASIRSAANLRWLDTAFKRAKAGGNYAMVIFAQADVWDIDDAPTGAAHLTAYKKYLDKIADKAKFFGNPILYVNGDSHVFRSDNPFQKGAPCYIEPAPGAVAVRCAAGLMPNGNMVDPYDTQPNGYDLPNLHRIVVHGSAMPMEWLKLTVDPTAKAPRSASAFGPFSWKRYQP